MDQRTRPDLQIEVYFRGIIEQTRELCRKSLDLLRQSQPDTFLGRKTQEPFPRLDFKATVPPFYLCECETPPLVQTSYDELGFANSRSDGTPPSRIDGRPPRQGSAS